MQELKILRQHIRKQRRNISPKNQQIAAQQLAQNILQQTFIANANHFALYIANDGEISPEIILNQLLIRNKSCFLPAVTKTDTNHLSFISYIAGDPLPLNHYGIPEPAFHEQKLITPQNLDIVFVPLVAFDKLGSRIGMGKGFYDRTFEFKKKAKAEKPLLIGLAHELQRVEHLEAQAWDVPLDYAITDKVVYCFE